MYEILFGLAAAVIALSYYYFTSTFNYWRERNVPFVKPYPLVGSMFTQLTLQEHMYEFFNRVYNNYKNEPFVGYFQFRTPTLLVRDPELIKSILVKDFSHFMNHGLQFSEEHDPLVARNLFNMENKKWKEMRVKLAPTFTSGRMKSMYPLVLECAEKLDVFVGQQADASQDVEVKDLMARFTTSVISTCAFGVMCDALNEPNDAFRITSKKLLETDFWRGIKVSLIAFMPELANMLRLKFFEAEHENFFRDIVYNVMTQRAKSGEKRKDFLQLLIELKETGRLSADENDEKVANNTTEEVTTQRLSELDVLAQALVFFFAGYETSSSAMQFALYELAKYPQVQEKAREHIEEVLQRHEGQLTYQALQEMTYLDWIFQEALRKYPSLSIFRKCTKDYVIPNTNITINKDTLILIPTVAMHHDSKYFDNPHEFIPERWSDEEMVKRNQYIYMPFGEGPRLCIGMRFARMQSKLGLLSVLRRYQVHPSTKTKDTLTWDPRQFLLTSKEDIYVTVTRA